MDAEKKLKAYSAMAETTRKWVTIMDAKAAFISTLNAGLLAFIWTGARLSGERHEVYLLALIATGFSFASLLVALRIVLPKFSWLSISGKYVEYKKEFKPVSFFGYVAKNYPLKADAKFIKDVEAMTETELAREALEQHFVTSHVAHYKSNLLLLAGAFFAVGLLLAGAALALK